MGKRAPEIRQGVNKGVRVYWVVYLCCGQPTGKEHQSKIGARVEAKAHRCG